MFVYSLLPGREESKIAQIEAYLRANKMFRNFTNAEEDPIFSQVKLSCLFIIPPPTHTRKPRNHPVSPSECEYVL